MSEIGIKQVFHLSVLSYYIYFDLTSILQLITNVSLIDGLKDEYLYMAPQFATVWTQCVFQDYILLSCLEDLLAFTSKTFLPSFKQILSDHANNLFVYYTLPFTVLICANFWVIFHIDPRLIDQYNVLFDTLDHHTNHIVHTAVIPILLVELFFTHRRYPPSLTVAQPLWKMSVPFACYWSVVFAMKLISPVWAYPYFRLMTPLQWVAYILANMGLAYIVYVFGYLCNAFIWGKNEESTEETKAKQEERNWMTQWSAFLRLVQVAQGR